MAKEFKAIADRHNIPYYMLGGSQLGAVRHGGFIPWDDDMDFGVPREHFQELLDLLDKELPEDMHLLTWRNSFLPNEMSKVEMKGTNMDNSADFIDNFRHDEGINIDIFPLDYGPNNVGRGRFFMSYRLPSLYLTYGYGNYRLVGYQRLWYALRYFHPLSKKTVINRIHKLFKGKTRDNQECIHNIFGMWGKKEIVPKEFFGKPTLYRFEDTEFYGVENADQYLKKLYGNYMQLPPEDRRHVHGAGYYAEEWVIEKYCK